MTKGQRLLDILVEVQRRELNLKNSSRLIMDLFNNDGTEEFVEPEKKIISEDFKRSDYPSSQDSGLGMYP